MATLNELVELIEARPTPTPEQFALARRYAMAHAPDLLEVLFGGQS